MNNECNEKTCPLQRAGLMSGIFRNLIHNPKKILNDYIRQDMWVLDVGCGVGFLAVTAAKLTGDQGKIIIVDIQSEMLDEAMKRMKKVGLDQRVIAIQCHQNSLCLDNYRDKIDFAYAFMMVHEVDNKKQLLANIYETLKKGGSLLIAEPYIHVSKSNFLDTVECATKIGFETEPVKKKINICRAVILKK